MQTVLPGQSYTALASRSASLLRVVLGTLTARLSWLTCSGSRYFRDKTNQALHSFSPLSLSLSLFFLSPGLWRRALSLSFSLSLFPRQNKPSTPFTIHSLYSLCRSLSLPSPLLRERAVPITRRQCFTLSCLLLLYIRSTECLPEGKDYSADVSDNSAWHHGCHDAASKRGDHLELCTCRLQCVPFKTKSLNGSSVVHRDRLQGLTAELMRHHTAQVQDSSSKPCDGKRGLARLSLTWRCHPVLQRQEIQLTTPEPK